MTFLLTTANCCAIRNERLQDVLYHRCTVQRSRSDNFVVCLEFVHRHTCGKLVYRPIEFEFNFYRYCLVFTLMAVPLLAATDNLQLLWQFVICDSTCQHSSRN